MATEISALIAFLRFLKKMFSIDTGIDIMDLQDLRPKVTQKVPLSLEKWEIDELIEKAGDIETRMLVELTFFTGARISEVLSLGKGSFKAGSADFDGTGPVETLFVKIRGKGRKERLIPLLPVIAGRVREYERYLDLKNAGKKEKLFDFSYKTAWRKIKNLGKGCGIDVHPHMLRHALASYLINRGIDSAIIKEILGHKSLNTTQIYTKVNMQSKARAFGIIETE